MMFIATILKPMASAQEGLEPGLRERKKERTRRLIADTARHLFGERGFEAVTVAEIARAAEVSEKTIFNYFPTKEDLFYSRLEAFEEELLAAIRRRDAGESILAAFIDFLLAPRGVLAIDSPDGDDEATRELRAITRVITESPALLARERQVFARYTDSLAALIADEAGAPADAIEPRVVANALFGVHRALIDHVRRRTLAGVRASEIARELRAEAERARALLERGLGDDHTIAGP
jgi:AcrR family transcriptional regulator